MRQRQTTPEEQLRLITECHQSGLTNYEWCKQHNIKISTFYSWIHRLKKSEEIEVPAAIATLVPKASPAPDIVKVTIEDEQQLPSEFGGSETNSYSAPMRSARSAFTVMEVTIHDIHLRVSNDVNPQLLAETIRLLRGVKC